MGVEDRLQQLGIRLPPPPGGLGTYRPALQSGAWIRVSGQVATRDGAIVHPGRLGAEQTLEAGQEAAQVAALNALAAVQQLRGNLEGLRVVRLVGYVASTPDFEQHPAVVDGASVLLRDLLGEEDGVGTRLAVGVASLPLRTPVELDLILEVRDEA